MIRNKYTGMFKGKGIFVRLIVWLIIRKMEIHDVFIKFYREICI